MKYLLITAILVGSMMITTPATAQDDPCNHHGTDSCVIVYAAIGDYQCLPAPVRTLDSQGGYEFGAKLACIEQFGVSRGEMYFGERRADGTDVGFSARLVDVTILRVERVR